MYIYLSAAVSLDGFIDDRSPGRLILSDEEDFEQVRRLRASFDAIMIGAETVRNDNPALVIRDPELRRRREACGKDPDIIKVTLTASGNLDPRSRFFTEGKGEKIVIAGAGIDPAAAARLSETARVLTAPEKITAETVVKMLDSEGIRSLMVEGGSSLMKLFLSSGLSDYLRLAHAPVILGSRGRVRLIESPDIIKCKCINLRHFYLAGETAVAEYSLKATEDDYIMMGRAIELAVLCPASDSAYSVGAVITTSAGETFTGYSRETAPDNHAEEEAVKKAVECGADLRGAVIYSSMEPCSERRSKPVSCSRLIIDHGFKKVVFAAGEPFVFVRCKGEQMLGDAGVEVVHMRDLEKEALLPNKHILK